jgi:hypothetical protein
MAMSPALATVNEPVNTAWKLNRVPAPACRPFPCATIVPVKLPFRSVVTLVNGRELTPTPDVFPGMVPDGGLKLMVGNAWMNAGVAVAGMLKGICLPPYCRLLSAFGPRGTPMRT